MNPCEIYRGHVRPEWITSAMFNPEAVMGLRAVR